MKMLTLILLILPVMIHGGEKNGAKALSIQTLLSDRERYNGQRVDVIGFLRVQFEVSAIYESETDARSARDSRSIWIKSSSIKSGCEPQICWTNDAFVRVVGVFTFREKLGSGHLGIWPAQIGEIELLAPTLSPRSVQGTIQFTKGELSLEEVRNVAAEALAAQGYSLPTDWTCSVHMRMSSENPGCIVDFYDKNFRRCFGVEFDKDGSITKVHVVDR